MNLNNLNDKIVDIYNKLYKELLNIGFYYCKKCQRIHSGIKTRIFYEHIIFSEKITVIQKINMRLKEKWNRLKIEQNKYGAVNLPRKRVIKND